MRVLASFHTRVGSLPSSNTMHENRGVSPNIKTVRNVWSADFMHRNGPPPSIVLGRVLETASTTSDSNIMDPLVFPLTV